MGDEVDQVVLSDTRCRLALHRPREFPRDGLDHLVTAVAGPFEAKLRAIAWLNPYGRFCNDLEGLYERLSGEVLLYGYENLELRVRGDGRGHIEAEVLMIGDHLLGIRLSFRIVVDQTQLPALIKSLRRVFVERR